MRILALVAAFGLAFAIAPKDASAVAHHEGVVVQKLRDSGNKLVGARVHMIVDSESYNRVRILVGKLKINPTDTRDAKAHLTSDEHRHIAAGIKPGYVRLQLGELQNLKLKPNQTTYHELQEVKFDLYFGEGHDIQAGEQVNIYSTFNHPMTNQTYWHVFGMHDGPVEVRDITHLHLMPTDTSAHGEATEFAQ